MRPSNERHPGSERGLQRVCAPLRYVSSGAQIMARSPSSRIKRIHRDVVPEFRVLAAENWPTLEDLSCPENQKRSLWVRETRRSEWQRSKKKASKDGGQLFTKVALSSNIFHRPFFATGPPLRLQSRPPNSGFARVLPWHCRHVIHAHLLGFWKLQNFLRPINASMK